MTSIFFRGVLFFCSYFPLTLIICYLQFGVWPWWVIALLGGLFGIVPLFGTWFYLWWVRRTIDPIRAKVTSFSKHDSEVMSYIASYLVPFVTFQLGDKQAVALLVFVGVLLILYVRSDMIYINPMLNIWGYHLYEVEVEHSRRAHYYIARKPLERYAEIRFVPLGNDIYLESKR